MVRKQKRKLFQDAGNLGRRALPLWAFPVLVLVLVLSGCKLLLREKIGGLPHVISRFRRTSWDHCWLKLFKSARQVKHCDALNPFTYSFYWLLIQSVPLGAVLTELLDSPSWRSLIVYPLLMYRYPQQGPVL